MTGTQISLAIIAVIVWGLVFLFMNRRTSSKEVAKILEDVLSQDKEESTRIPAPTDDREDIYDNLIKFFELSSSSRNILRVIVNSEDKLSFNLIMTEFNALRGRKGQLPLPESAIRPIIMNLMGSNFIQLRDGEFSATPAGHEIIERLKLTPNETKR
jgi:hypothetical protein